MSSLKSINNKSRISNNPTNTNTFNPLFNPSIVINVTGCTGVNQCECSARLNFREEVTTASANICPNCQLGNSFFSFSDPDASFLSTAVNLPDCISSNGANIMNVTGSGTLTVEGESNHVTFSLILGETAVGDDVVTFFAAGIDEIGTIFFSVFQIIVPDRDLTVTPCSSLSPSPSSNSNQISNLLKSRDRLNKGRLITMKNGQVQERQI